MRKVSVRKELVRGFKRNGHAVFESLEQRLLLSADFDFAFGTGSVLDDSAHSTAIDRDGNIYISGEFFDLSDSSIESFPDFDPGNTGSGELVSAGGRDAFVAQYAPSGELNWVRRMGGASQDKAASITVDDRSDLRSEWSVYTSGNYQGMASFGGDLSTILNAEDSGEAYVVKIGYAGDLLWAKGLGGNGAAGNGIAVDSQGDVVTVGHFVGQSDFDPATTDFDLGTNEHGTTQVFVSKIDSAGQFVWARELGQSTANHPVSAELDCGGGLISCDNTAAAVTIGPDRDITVIGTTALDTGSDHLFIAKLDSDGNFVWDEPVIEATNQVVGKSASIGAGVVSDDLGNVYVTGHFFGQVDFDDTGAATVLTSEGSADAFVTKYDMDGKVSWIGQAGGILDDFATDVALDVIGDVYLTGGFSGTANFDVVSNPDGTLGLAESAGQSDVFALKYDPYGNFEWVTSYGGAGHDSGQSIALSDTGKVVAVGDFSEAVVFSNDPVMGAIGSQGARDILVMQLEQSRFVQAPDRMAVFHTDGQWSFDWDGAGTDQEQQLYYGLPGDVPVSGDWDGDGLDQMALFRDGRWFFDLDGDGFKAEHSTWFGLPGDVPVTGDWDGDGVDQMGLYRDGQWFFDLDGQGGIGESGTWFGLPGDVPLTGDWDGDGIDQLALVRSHQWFFDLDQQGAIAEKSFWFGIEDDIPVIGDWNGDHIDDAGLFRDGSWFFDLDDQGQVGEHRLEFGAATHIPVVGVWAPELASEPLLHGPVAMHASMTVQSSGGFISSLSYFDDIWDQSAPHTEQGVWSMFSDDSDRFEMSAGSSTVHDGALLDYLEERK